jgi:hypothetical protein
MSRDLTPALAASVMNPLRSECPANRSLSANGGITFTMPAPSWTVFDFRARVVFQRASRVRIQSQQPIDVHSDKAIVDGKPVLDIAIVPKALRVVAGQGIGVTSPVDAVPSQPPLPGPQAMSDDRLASPTTQASNASDRAHRPASS